MRRRERKVAQIQSENGSYLTFDAARVIAWREAFLQPGDDCTGTHYQNGKGDTFYGFEIKRPRKEVKRHFGIVVNDNVGGDRRKAGNFSYHNIEEYKTIIYNWTEIP